ncbi:Aldolase-type TIM barrel [Penicillium cf. griseofulvum]|uniref:Aldolase-type TIM barrel n=1 Tax=Penicillium cf. griseofulvum TaxID=2972120 RepID=A0A9W9MSD9_9EURO|nr:Aldolase-type TIM barrel [Penicillium cf. griseofulvum]KAJ5440481.1 Aldolase-type TIM barrel [Penicillium cf. griseofulvum]KAJ5448527.1 Aldolase-type TIM barrel [Penicillium cf. griseofulvum]
MGSLSVSPQPHVPTSGVWCPAVTFFHHDTDTLDLDSQSKYFTYLSTTGLAGLVILGTNSEAFLLTREERSQLISTARTAVGPDFPLMAGVGAHSTKQTLQLAKDAADAGANYLLRFFSEVAAKSPLPVVVYNFPGVCNGVDMDSETITAIARESAASGRSNVVGVKLTCGSVGKITRLAASFAPEEFATFGGQSDFLIGGLAAGSAGCIAAFANVFPKVAARIYALYQKGLIEEAVALQRKAALAESAIKSGIASTKHAVACYSAKLAGIPNAAGNLAPRHPYEEVGEGAKVVIREVMAEVSEIEKSL